jgi:hypothetical protein
MTPNRRSLLLGLGLLVMLIGAPAIADEGVGGMQLFAPADISPYGRGPQPNEGYFFVFDGLYWSITPPKAVTVGIPFDPADPDSFRGGNHSSLDTGMFNADFNPGQRIEFGRVVGHHGWMFSTYRVNEQTQDPLPAFTVPVMFHDPLNLLQIGPLPVQSIYGTVTMRNWMVTWGAEADYIYRMHAFHKGTVCEWMFGARYLEFNEEFNVDAVGGILDDSFWYTSVENHIVGPQLGVRLFHKGASRFMFNTEGRFFAGYNSQNFKQTALLGGKLNDVAAPLLWRGAYSSAHEFKGEWTPGIEVRLEMRYQMTRALSIRAGWTGMWLDGIARANNSVNYEVPAMGLLTADNRQSLFMHGLTLGVDINR